MVTRIHIKLAVPVIIPLIELIRQQADQMAIADPATLKGQMDRQQVNWLEVHRLLELFSYPDFSNSGVITVDRSEGPVVLRACSYLRIQLRKSALSSIPDTVLETGNLDPEKYIGDERPSFTCYCFLATLQETIVEKLLAVPTFSPGTIRMWQALVSPVKKFFSKQKQPLEDANSMATSEVWQVMVLNDPVNLMSYVTTVFKSALNLPEEVASRRMREVHELKSSVVWEGPKLQGETYANALQAWHLQVELRRKASHTAGPAS
ncbi:MAG: ATP-dependent Clp protease adaptor ClpS [Nibricoccus sp.]